MKLYLLSLISALFFMVVIADPLPETELESGGEPESGAEPESGTQPDTSGEPEAGNHSESEPNSALLAYGNFVAAFGSFIVCKLLK